MKGRAAAPVAQRRQHRRLDLDVAVIFENAPQLTHDRRTTLEYFTRGQRFVFLEFQTSGDQIRVALALSNLRIVNAVHLVRQRQQCFRQKLNLLHVDRKLAGAGHKQETFDADEVAVVQQLKQRPAVNFAAVRTVVHANDVSFANVDLQARHAIRKMNERDLAHQRAAATRCGRRPARQTCSVLQAVGSRETSRRPQ